MVSGEQLSVGDKVRIVDEWQEPHRENIDGFMDKYLSTVMTVRRVCGANVRMEEDQGDHGRTDGWCWYPEMLAEIVFLNPDEPFEIDGAVFDSLFSS